jgi:hypothetical protein
MVMVLRKDGLFAMDNPLSGKSYASSKRLSVAQGELIPELILALILVSVCYVESHLKKLLPSSIP